MNKLIIIPLVLLLMQFAVQSHGASVAVVPGGNGVYYVNAINFVDVGGVEVEVQYDTATLANPRISQGSKLASTMFVPNPRFTPSSVKIAAMSLTAIQGSGDLAVITFDVIGARPGFVVVSWSKLARSTGSSIAQTNPPATVVPVVVVPGAVTPTDTSTGANTGITSSGSSSGVSVSGGSAGTITLPLDQMEAATRKIDTQPLVTDLRKDMTVPVSGSESSTAATASKSTSQDKDAEKQYDPYIGVLELFKAFKGERTMKSLVSLFAEADLPAFSQTPAVAIADGKTPVKITLILKPSGNESPKFMMQGASARQLNSEGEGGTWTIEAVPKKDVYEARLTVMVGARMLEYPLTVTPAIDPLLTKGKKLSEADFSLYLAKPPKYDFNRDGKYDVLDDFIYTANYIVAMKIKPEKSSKIESKGKAPVEKKEPVTGKEIKVNDGKLKDDKAKDDKAKDDKAKDDKAKDDKAKDDKAKDGIKAPTKTPEK